MTLSFFQEIRKEKERDIVGGGVKCRTPTSRTDVLTDSSKLKCNSKENLHLHVAEYRHISDLVEFSE